MNPPRFVQNTSTGSSGHINDFKTRTEFDAAIVWRLQNMGVGNVSEIREQQALHRRAQYLQLWWVDRVVAQTVQQDEQTFAAAAACDPQSAL